MTKTPQAKRTKPATKENYTIRFLIGDDVYEEKGDSILSALKKIKPRKYMGIIKVEATFDGKTSRVPLRLVPLKMKRLFMNPIEMEIFAKRLNTLL